MFHYCFWYIMRCRHKYFLLKCGGLSLFPSLLRVLTKNVIEFYFFNLKYIETTIFLSFFIIVTRMNDINTFLNVKLYFLDILFF